MADGIRIRPSAAALAAVGIADGRDRPWIVRDLSRPLNGPPWPDCSFCGHHEVKTYHFQLDGEGTIIVSTTIWDRLQAMFDCGGFEKANIVAKPPSQGLVLPSAKVQTITPDI